MDIAQGTRAGVGARGERRLHALKSAAIMTRSAENAYSPPSLPELTFSSDTSLPRSFVAVMAAGAQGQIVSSSSSAVVSSSSAVEDGPSKKKRKKKDEIDDIFGF